MSSDSLSSDASLVGDVEKINVIGTGFIGLPLALQLAHAGKTVVGVDIDENLVEAINDQSLHLDEDDLQRLLESDTVNENLIAKTAPEQGDAFVISVPTPLTHPQKSPDLTAVEAAIDSVIPHLTEGDIVNIESTIPPLTCEEVIAPRLVDAGFEPGVDVHLAHSPERILPGNVFEEIVNNDRVIGGVTPQSATATAKIYKPFLEGEIHYTDLLSAELCKLMENTYRDVNIGLANEFALIGDELEKDMTEVIELANKHPRVDILRPGIGVGGHCIPIDPWFLNEVDPEHTNLITSARRINDMMPQAVTRKIRRELREYRDPTLLVLGAAYKPDTHDARESPAEGIVQDLRADGYDIAHYDRFIDGLEYDDLEALVEEIAPDVIVQLVDHTETTADLRRLAEEFEQDSIEILPVGRGNPLLPRNE